MTAGTADNRVRLVPFAPKLVDDPSEKAAVFVLRDLLRAGWRVHLSPPEPGADPRASIRAQMEGARREKLAESAPFMARMVRGGVKALLSDGPVGEEVRPFMQRCRGDGTDEVTGLPLTSVFRWMRLKFWANPYERPPGRSLTYLVRDGSRPLSPVMGLVQISSPVLQIACREEFIGWPSMDRKKEVVGKSLMEATTVGAVPPYGSILAGKLCALLCLSDRVRNDWRETYGDEAVWIGTTALYGVEPNQYTRCALPGGPRWRKLGMTAGYGTQTVGKEARRAVEAVTEIPERWANSNGAGGGGRMRLLAKWFEGMEGGRGFLLHGNRRVVYGSVLARNALEFLRGGWRRWTGSTHGLRTA